MNSATAQHNESETTDAPPPKRTSVFPALQNSNYRIYFSGQLVSVIGTWLQIVAQGWLVLQLTQSAFLIGLVAALATTPSLLFSLFGGVIVDRFPKKRILFFTQLTNTALALTLGILTILGLASIPIICVLAFCMGTVNALDAPARQAFIPEVVTKDELASAVALNSAVFNAGRVIGPVIAGILIAVVGTGWAFIANAVSYAAVLIALRFMHIKPSPPSPPQHPFTAIRQGVQYAFAHPIIRVLLVYVAILSIFGWSYSTLMPIIAQTGFGLGATGLGWLYTATGLGSLLATLVVSAGAKRIRPTYFVVGGAVIFSISLMFFAQTNSLKAALPLLFLVGMGLISQSAMTTTMIQSMVESQFRGRVMSIYVLMFLGMSPVGNFLVGFLSDRLGYATAITINAGVVLVAGLSLLLLRNKIRAAYLTYKSTLPQ
ncbi:MFS transporter [Paracnuella aquatica]|uniref:MFS transporter n=1 Tax=Paracnuella aquatica TaxID=2268757 RepID=UPI000DEEAB20|nr:MFS transporter [Paracnuella aquatica]RPD47352.1 MFS transporter [Paracnuella aquatica]